MNIKRKTALLPIIMLILFSLLLSFCTFADEDDVVTTEPESEIEPEPEPEPDVREFAGNIALYCIDTETMLYEKNSDEVCAPSASAKLMTALVTMDKIADLEERVDITSEMLRGTTGLIYGFSAGKSVSYDDLITALIMRNANDAALILARSISGSLSGSIVLASSKHISPFVSYRVSYARLVCGSISQYPTGKKISPTFSSPERNPPMPANISRYLIFLSLKSHTSFLLLCFFLF